jgi:hypothetical protein
MNMTTPLTSECDWCVPVGSVCGAIFFASVLFAIAAVILIRARARFRGLASSAPPAWEATAPTEWSGISLLASPSSLATDASGASAEGPRRRPRTPRAGSERRAVFSPQRAQRVAAAGAAAGETAEEEKRLREALSQLESTQVVAPPPAAPPPPPPPLSVVTS